MKKKIASRSFLVLFVLWFCGINNFCTAQTGFPYVVENVSWSSHNDVIHFAGDIISPSNSTSPATIDGTSNVEFLAGHAITLSDGFTASATNSSFNFRAAIEEPIECVLINPSPATSIDANGIVHINKWEKLEIGFTMPADYQAVIDNFFYNYYTYGASNQNTDINPYADDSLNVEITLTSSQGHTVTKWGFFMREAIWGDPYNQQSTSETDVLHENPVSPFYKYNWRFRFAPDEVDATVPWQFTITISNPQTNPGLPTYTFTGFKFICDDPLPTNKGFLRVNQTNKRFLEFENHEPFFGIGENLADLYNDHWSSNTDADKSYRMYKRNYDQFMNALDELHSAGGNYARFIFFERFCAPEWEHIGVYDQFEPAIFCPGGDPLLLYGSNRQFQCWMFDQLLDRMHEDNIYAQLATEINVPKAGAETYIWGGSSYIDYLRSVYSMEARPDLDSYNYFSDSNLRNFFKRKYKYILSRWGYSTNIALIEPFNEIDHTLGYYSFDVDIDAIARAECPPDETIIEDPNIRAAIVNWYEDVLGDYIKGTLEGGVDGKNKHLYTVSTTGYETYNADNYSDAIDHPFQQLFGKDYIDVADVHSYGDGIGQQTAWYRITNEEATPGASQGIPQLYDKPFHLGECGAFGSIDINHTSTIAWDDLQTCNYYNNYDISLHNQSWATALMGNCIVGMSWQWKMIHRWEGAVPDNNGAAIPHLAEVPFSLPLVYNPLTTGTVTQPTTGGNTKIHSLYHNFKKLSEFVQMIDHNSLLTPRKIFNTNSSIECYYLTNGYGMSYGWVHDIDRYWANDYFYKERPSNGSHDEYDNLLGYADPLLTTPATTFQLEGFLPSTDYTVVFYPTRMESEDAVPVPQPLPSDALVTSDASGSITIDLSSMPLGWNSLALNGDSIDADYAFTVDYFHNVMRTTQQNSENRTQSISATADFSIYPNPAQGVFSIAIPGIGLSVTADIFVYDFTGRIIQESNISQPLFILNLSEFAKGIYFIKVKSSVAEKIKRIIVE